MQVPKYYYTALIRLFVVVVVVITFSLGVIFALTFCLSKLHFPLYSSFLLDMKG